MISWGEFARVEPELAAFGAGRLGVPPAYLATVRQSGAPRVHPVTPIVTAHGLFLFMEPTSPKGRATSSTTSMAPPRSRSRTPITRFPP